MAKEKKKKSKLKTYLIMTGGFFIFCLFMLMGASSASVGTEGSRQASVASAQTSLLESYINSRSEQQRALVEAAKTENTSRGGTDTKGGKSYIKKLAPEKTKFNVSWDSYFVGQMMANAGIDISEWDAAASVFATKLHKSGKFSIAENYIPREGNIVFWGKKLRSLSAGQTIKARHCGIVTKVEMITDHTLIKAMRITVIEGDVEGGNKNGNYDHTSAYVEAYTYDLYDTQGNNHHGSSASYEQIMGYGTVAEDVEAVESTTDTSDYEHLVYTIDLKSTYDEAVQEGSTL